jgi:hypothetical protein
LKDLGVEQRHVAQLAPMAAVDLTAPSNPIAVDERSLAALYQQAISGQMV